MRMRTFRVRYIFHSLSEKPKGIHVDYLRSVIAHHTHKKNKIECGQMKNN